MEIYLTESNCRVPRHYDGCNPVYDDDVVGKNRIEARNNDFH